MDEETLDELRSRFAARPAPADVDAVLERARSQIEALAAIAAELETAIPERVGSAIREGLRAEAAPMSRRVSEIRGLMNQVVRRLERLEGDLTAERYARVDDLALLVDLISASWRSVEQRLSRIEETLGGDEAPIVRLDERRETA
jgi:hypothetical protein